MKKILCLIFVCFMALCIVGCGSDTDKDDASSSKTEKTVSQIKQKSDDSYIDLTKLSSTMVYSEVYNMMTNPSDYIGKKVKMNGKFALYYAYDENDKPIPDQYYFTCVIADATACCQQGLEFVLADGKKYPEDYPKLNTDITVIGEFQSYTEGENRYYHLVNAEIES